MAKIFSFNEGLNGSYIDPISGAAATNTNGVFKRTEKGMAYYGSGGNYIQISNQVLSKDNGGLVMWFKVTNPITQGLLSKDGAGSLAWIYVIESNTITIESDTNHDKWIASKPINGNDWNCLVVSTYNGDVVVYLNGTRYTGTATDDLSFDTIGRSSSSHVGYIAKVDLYDHTLSEKEMAQAYKQFLNAHPTLPELRPRLNINEYKPTDLSHLVDSRIGIPEADTSSMLDSDKGSFATDIESWLVQGNNTAERVADVDAENGYALKVSYVDSATGANNSFRDTFDLDSDLIIGKKYKVSFRAKVNSGSTVLMRCYYGGDLGSVSITNTSYEWGYIVFTANNVSSIIFQCTGMGAGEVVYIDQWDIREWDGEELVPDDDYGFSLNKKNDIASNGWGEYGTNVISQDGNYVKCEYVDNNNGMYTYLRTDYHTTLVNGIANQKYTITFKYKVSSGASLEIGFYDGSVYNKLTLDQTTDTIVTTEQTLLSGTGFTVRFDAMGANEIVWIEFLSVKKITGLVAAYNMIPNGNTLVDISGNGYDFTLTNVNSSKKGLILNDKHIAEPIATDLNIGYGFTICGRIGKLENSGLSYAAIMSIGSTRLYMRVLSNGITQTQLYDGGESIDPSGYITDANRKNGFSFCLTYIGKTSSFYIDTVLAEFDSNSNFDEDDFNEQLNLSNFGIGVRGATSDYPRLLELEDFRIYNYAFNEQQVKDYHNSFVKPVLIEDFSNYPVGQTI